VTHRATLALSAVVELIVHVADALRQRRSTSWSGGTWMPAAECSRPSSWTVYVWPPLVTSEHVTCVTTGSVGMMLAVADADSEPVYVPLFGADEYEHFESSECRVYEPVPDSSSAAAPGATAPPQPMQAAWAGMPVMAMAAAAAPTSTRARTRTPLRVGNVTLTHVRVRR
jgi:hypothetical protein